ncbi:hypothetical protein D3C71_1367390 [compost metagenome]
MEYFFNGCIEEVVYVYNCRILHSFRERSLSFIQHFEGSFDYFLRIRSCCLIHCNSQTECSVYTNRARITLSSQFDAGNVFQTQNLTVFANTDNNVTELRIFF